MEKDQLLTCPFCGAPARGPFRIATSGRQRSIWEIECALFCVSMRDSTKKGIIERWNKRHYPLEVGIK